MASTRSVNTYDKLDEYSDESDAQDESQDDDDDEDEEEEDSSSEESEEESSEEEEDEDSSSEESEEESDSDYDSDADLVYLKLITPSEVRAREYPLDDDISYKRFQKQLKKEYPDISISSVDYDDMEGDTITIKDTKDFKVALRQAFKVQRKQEDAEVPVKSLRLKLNVAEDISSNNSNNSSNNNNTVELTSSLTHKPKNGGKLVWRKGTLLGKGAFGQVFKAFNHHTGIEFACKQVNLKNISEDKRKKAELMSLKNEIDVLKTLTHPNIISYLGTELTNKNLFVFMQFAAGGSLSSLLKRWGALCENVVRRYASGIISGLKYLHDKGIAHRDIKPSNVLLHDGVVKLADFGTAKFMSNGNGDGEGVEFVKESFTSGVNVGTGIYMAPEVMMAGGEEMEMEMSKNGSERKIRKSDDVVKLDPRKTDIWSLACTLSEMSTGLPSFPSQAVAVYQICLLKSPPKIPTNLSPTGQNLLKICWNFNSNERPGCEELEEHDFMEVDQTMDDPQFLKTTRMPKSGGDRLEVDTNYEDAEDETGMSSNDWGYDENVVNFGESEGDSDNETYSALTGMSLSAFEGFEGFERKTSKRGKGFDSEESKSKNEDDGRNSRRNREKSKSVSPTKSNKSKIKSKSVSPRKSRGMKDRQAKTQGFFYDGDDDDDDDDGDGGIINTLIENHSS